MNAETQITLNVTLGMVNAILTGLSHLPYNQVVQVIQEVQSQAEAQMKTVEAESPVEE